MGDAFDLFIAGSFGDAFNHGGFIHLIWNFTDDNRKTVTADFFDGGFSAGHNAAATFEVCFAGAGAAQHNTTGWEVGAGNVFDQFFGREVGVFDQG